MMFVVCRAMCVLGYLLRGSLVQRASSLYAWVARAWLLVQSQSQKGAAATQICVGLPPGGGVVLALQPKDPRPIHSALPRNVISKFPFSFIFFNSLIVSM